jgi:hypothetical protein
MSRPNVVLMDGPFAGEQRRVDSVETTEILRLPGEDGGWESYRRTTVTRRVQRRTLHEYDWFAHDDDDEA